MRRRCRAVAALLGFVSLIATSAGCGAGEEQADGRLQAIAGSYPLAFAAEEIGGMRSWS